MKDNDRTPSEELEGDRVHLPGFIREGDIGLGDMVKRATSRFGIRPCGGCERRAAVLNRWFSPAGDRSSENRTNSFSKRKGHHGQ